MKNSEIFLVFAEKTIDNNRFLVRAKELKVKMMPLFERDLTVILRKNTTRVLFKGRDITLRILCGRIIFRGKGRAKNTVIALAKFAEQNRIPFLDSVASIALSGKTCYLPNVKLQHIYHIPTIFCEQVSDLPKKVWFKSPFLIKPACGRRGEDVRVVQKISDIPKHPWKAVLIQPKLNFDAEYRVLVLKNRILAIAEKIKNKGSLVANFSRGSQFHSTNLPTVIEKEAIAICQKIGVEIGGVDLAKIGKHFYLLEVNRACGICGVESSTGVDASGEIIKFLLSK
ncbi:MAG: hypothetical protein ABIE14_05715 [Patescibacteria group bacterium]